MVAPRSRPPTAREFPLRTAVALLSVATAFLTAGCGDQMPTAPDGSSRAQAAPISWIAGDRLARLLALGLRDSSARVHLRDALRASPVNEHRLLLQSFAASADGRVVVDAAAKAGALPAAEVQALIAALPPTDLVIPYTAHRLAWRATPDLVVGALGSRTDSLLTAYAPAGATVIVNGKRTAAAQTLVMLERARGKDLRIDAQPANRPGAVVQDPDDGELAGSVSYSVGPGQWAVAQLANFMTARGGRSGELLLKKGARFQARYLTACDPTAVDCQPPDPMVDTSVTVIPPGDTTYYDSPDPVDSLTFGASPSLVSGTPPVDTTRLVQFIANYDDGLFDSYVEPYFKARYLGALSVVRFKHIKEHKWYYPNTPLIFRRFAEGTLDYVEVEVWEDEKLDLDKHCIFNGRPQRSYLGSNENGKRLRYDCNGWGGVDFVAAWTVKPRPPVDNVHVRIAWGTYDADRNLYAGCESAVAPSVQAYAADGTRLDIPNSGITLASDHPEAATLVFDPQNGPYNANRFKLYANGPGPAKLQATIEGVSGYLDVTVRPLMTSVSVTPASATISAGGNQQLTATAYAGTQVMRACWMSMGATGYEYPLVPTVWRSENPAVAPVSSTGLVSGASAGSSTIHAGIGIYDGTSAITVTSVYRVLVDPASATIDVAGKVQLSATPVDFYGSAVPGKTVTWSSENATVATVSVAGLVTGRAAGTAYIYATVDGVRGSSVIAVRAPPADRGTDCGTRRIC